MQLRCNASSLVHASNVFGESSEVLGIGFASRNHLGSRRWPNWHAARSDCHLRFRSSPQYVIVLLGVVLQDFSWRSREVAKESKSEKETDRFFLCDKIWDPSCCLYIRVAIVSERMSHAEWTKDASCSPSCKRKGRRAPRCVLNVFACHVAMCWTFLRMARDSPTRIRRKGAFIDSRESRWIGRFCWPYAKPRYGNLFWYHTTDICIFKILRSGGFWWLVCLLAWLRCVIFVST